MFFSGHGELRFLWDFQVEVTRRPADIYGSCIPGTFISVLTMRFTSVPICRFKSSF